MTYIKYIINKKHKKKSNNKQRYSRRNTVQTAFDVVAFYLAIPFYRTINKLIYNNV